ncbi:MAG TPA: hypothetical protein VFH95_05350 [Candidatus Kapabacteria bacterium]|nr:hypothetical protein [Candidatus Kapabacteria bacterium]
MIILHSSSTRSARSSAMAQPANAPSMGLRGTAGAAIVAFAVLAALVSNSWARLSTSSVKSKKGGEQVLNFLRQRNVYSNLDFYYTNRGVLFNSGAGNAFEGLFWPRGSGNSYIFGEGLWFATQKKLSDGKRHKLCELGYNPNSGAGWYIEGEYASVRGTTTDQATPGAKYISYVGWRYDKSSGKYLSGTSSVVPSPYYSWPLWDTSTTKTLDRNYYFGDYISDVTKRNISSLQAISKPNPKPAILSEEDIVNQYTDEDPSNNPEFRAGTGYPFGIDVSEAIYSWSFGRYRDMIFLRQKVTNSSQDSLLNCWIAPAFDPDLDDNGPGAAQQDQNSYVNSALVAQYADPADVAQLRQPYRSDPTKLNMGVQWRNLTQPPNGKQYGWIGFSFLESPVIDSAGNIIDNSDSAALQGYGPNSLFQKNSLGLVTFKDWTISNDPSTQDLRYDFVSSGEKDLTSSSPNDQRLMMATGPFTLPPGKSVETVVGITIAQVDNIDYKKNFGALLLLTDFAHQVFGEVDSVKLADGSEGYSVNHFLSPVPPDVPNMKTTGLDKAVLVTWDSAAEHSADVVSDNVGFDTIVVKGDTTHHLQSKATLPFIGYQLWRSSRSDHDSTIRPDGNNPDVMLGQWALYDFRTDTIWNSTNSHYYHLHYTRLNTTPHAIPHSYLDIGDDNHDGILTGNEGLYNGVQYYYYLIAYDEYDSTNQVGPLYTSVVPPKNFLVGIPNRPVYLVPFSGDTASGVAGNCLAGHANPADQCPTCSGGLLDVRLDIVDTGIFAKLFTNDTINVSFQPRWTEYVNFNQSPLEMYVDVTDNRQGIQNTYAKMQNPANNTLGYYFPILPEGTIVAHVNGTITPDSGFASQFTTDNSAFSPNQSIDNAFKVLADMNFEQLSSPYRLSSVVVTPGSNNPSLDENILRLSRRTNMGGALDSNQNIFNLPGDSAIRPPILLFNKKITLKGTNHTIGQIDTVIQLGTSNDSIFTLDSAIVGDTTVDSTTNPGVYDTSITYLSHTVIYQYRINSTRPSYLGALGETAYDVTFDSLLSPGPVTIVMSDTSQKLRPDALHVKVSLRDCPQAVLRSVQDTATDMTEELNYLFYSDINNNNTAKVWVPGYDDPDIFYVPNPGWFQMTAWHYEDANPPGTPHTTTAIFDAQDVQDSGRGTVGPYYFPINGKGNVESNGTTYHYAVHRLSVGGAELLFNAPEIPDFSGTTTGDTIAGTASRLGGDHVNPHMNDFQVGDKITLSFTGVMKNLPFPGSQFHIYTEGGSKVDFANASNYTDSLLQQVQVVPNPYVVTHLGQTSTDNAKLFFTRLPPRCTIEIYALDGTLVATLEHNGYADTGQTVTNYDYNQLADQSSVETWNLLTSGKQRVGSQVLFARVVAKDPVTGAETGEITTKFAVVVGLSK